MANNESHAIDNSDSRIAKLLSEVNTCSSSDTSSDQEDSVRERKRRKIKIKCKSPVHGYYKKQKFTPDTSKQPIVLDRITENQLDCSLGREAFDDMFTENAESQPDPG